MTASPAPARDGLYGPVGLLSALVTLIVIGAAAAVYASSATGTSGMVAILAAAVLGTNVVAGLVARRGRPETAIALLAGATLVAATAAPLFIADVSLPNLLLLAAVPIQVGIVNRLRRVLPVTIITIVAAAAMVAVDVAELPNRSTVLVDRPGAVLLTAALFAAQFIVLIFLLWWLRLRAQSRHYVRLDLATQLPIVFAVISAISILVVTGVLVAQIRDAQVAQVQRNFRTLAEISAERVGNSLDTQVGALLALGRRGTTLLEGLDAANAEYPATPAEQARLLADREAEWLASADTSDFVLRYRNNDLSLELSRFRGADLLHNNVVLTDRYGGLVAAQGARPERFSFAGQDWWQAAYANGTGGVHLGNLVIDPATDDAYILIAVGVLNPTTNQTIGVLASTYRLSGIQREIMAGSAQVSAQVRLIGPDGILIAGPDPAEVGQLTPAARLALGVEQRQAVETPALLLAQAPLTATSLVNTEVLAGLGWQVIVSDALSAALAEVSRSTKIAGLVGLLAIALGVIAAVAIARVVTRPIESLTATAAAISAGDLEQRANPVGPVELVTLAEAFNTLTGRLRSLIGGLQEQVEERTSQLQAAKEAAEAANEAKSTFLASVSHELRTPLTSVLGFAKVIRRQLEERIIPRVDAQDERTQRAIAQVRENVDVIVTEGERLTTLVNNVLDLAKIEAGRFDWKMQEVSVRDVADRAMAATAALFESKQLELRRDIPDELPTVIADRDGLMQVVINLLSNAVKFTEQGSVTCSARLTAEGVVVSVADTGIGIAPADQAVVFDKFTQVGDTLTDKPHGTGLGLPICREIVERHGGRIWVESEVGAGSVFSFMLPLHTGEAPSGGDGPPVREKEAVSVAERRTDGRRDGVTTIVDEQAGGRERQWTE